MTKQTKFYTVLVCLLLVVSILLGLTIEFASLTILKRKNRALPFFYAASEKNVGDLLGYTIPYRNVDPHLGYALVPPFTEYGAETQVKNKIVTLGGSTTDPIVEPNNWSLKISQECDQAGYSCRVFNGGVGGYESSQELFKLIRDARPLKPKVIISMNGVNDLEQVPKTGSSMIHSYQSQLMYFLAKPQNRTRGLFPNTVYLIRTFLSKLSEKTNSVQAQTGMSFGFHNGLSPVEQWEENVRMMHSVSAEFGIDYLVVLQPLLGFGKYTWSDSDRAAWDQAKKSFGADYQDKINNFYPKAKEICGELSYCVDLTDVFQNANSVYKDARHPDETGHALEAQAIFEELVKRNLLQR